MWSLCPVYVSKIRWIRYDSTPRAQRQGRILIKCDFDQILACISCAFSFPVTIMNCEPEAVAPTTSYTFMFTSGCGLNVAIIFWSDRVCQHADRV